MKVISMNNGQAGKCCTNKGATFNCHRMALGRVSQGIAQYKDMPLTVIARKTLNRA